MMFNYGLDSNAAVIFEGMQKEAVPARLMNEAVDGDYLQNGYFYLIATSLEICNLCELLKKVHIVHTEDYTNNIT